MWHPEGIVVADENHENVSVVGVFFFKNGGLATGIARFNISGCFSITAGDHLFFLNGASTTPGREGRGKGMVGLRVITFS